MSFTVAVWFWIGFNNRPSYPMYLSVGVAQESDYITCQSESIDIPFVDCEKSYMTVAMPSNEGHRIPLSRLAFVCNQGTATAHIEIACKK
jgi:hypothetical protein